MQKVRVVDSLFLPKTEPEARAALKAQAAEVITSHMESFKTSFSIVQQKLVAKWTHGQTRNMCNVYFLWTSGMQTGMQMCQPYFFTLDDTSSSN